MYLSLMFKNLADSNDIVRAQGDVIAQDVDCFHAHLYALQIMGGIIHV